MEFEGNMYRSCVDPLIDVLNHLLHDIVTDSSAATDDDDDPVLVLKDQLNREHHVLKKSIRVAHRDLKFFKMFFWGLAYQEQSLENCGLLRYVWRNMMCNFTKIAKECRKMQFEGAADTEQFANWEPTIYRLRKHIQKCKPLVKEICLFVLDTELHIKHFHFEEFFLDYEANTVSLIDLIFENLRDLDKKFAMPATTNQQFAFIDGKLKVFGKFANHISCLACLYWIWEMDDGLRRDMECMLSGLMPKYLPYIDEIIELYFEVFSVNSIDDQQSGRIRLLMVNYVNHLYDYFVVVSDDDHEKCYEGLLFLFLFSMDPPKVDSVENKFLLANINGIIRELPSIFCSLEIQLSGFLQKIDRVKEQVEELYVVRPLSSELHSPKTNVLGFLNFFLANLERILELEYLISFHKYYIVTVQEELVSLEPLLQANMQLQSHKDLWTQIVNLVYFAAYITHLSSSSCYHAWYGVLCLPNLIQDIKMVKTEVMKTIENDLSLELLEMDKSCVNAFHSGATTSENGEAFVGYKQDEKEILNHLIRGPKDLTIISISGMAGQGKTTLAKRIYNDPSIHHHFHEKVWCYVSREYKMRIILVSIARDVGCNVHGNIEVDDLIECIRRSLKRKRYLIVLDDIWDVEVWHQLEDSFPNDKYGSRILFTSQEHHLALQAKPSSVTHRLRPFSNEECWELMKAKLCNCDGFPQALVKIGERIAVYCNGLPLAVVLISCHLNRIPKVVDLWEQVAENLKSHLASEGCMHVIELSYEFLPDHLKPCFLYLGAFPRGQDIRVRKLKLLWIAEGFVKENEKQLAEEYLDGLVSRNLVVATKVSSIGGIKECRVHHDLLYDLCLEKAEQDDFLHLVDESIASDTLRYDYYHRLCITKNGPFTQPKSVGTRRELPTSQIHTLLFQVHTVPYLFYFLGTFRVLTVLDLGAVSLPKFPKIILNNDHLRYLAVYAKAKHIPWSINDLWYLETLILRCSHNVRIPHYLWEMERLTYVDVDKCTLQASMCMVGTCNIEVLKGMVLDYGVHTEEFLNRLVMLKKLKCYSRGNEGVIDPLWFSMFGSLENLESLHLQNVEGWYDSSVHQQVLALNFPNNLKKLTLRLFGLPWSTMSMIGKLSNLEVLKLYWNACAGSIWHLGDGEFSNLRYLKLYDMEVEHIDDFGCDETPFPRLEKLFLMHCWKLTEIPSSFGDICTLDTIDVTGSKRVLDSVREVVEKQQDVGNQNLQVFGLRT